MTLNILLPSTIFVIIMSFILQRKHMLMALLCLEAIILSLVLMLIMNWSPLPQNMTPLFIILLTLGACEASLGLALLVSMARSVGTDMLNLLTNNKC
uniref:NADH-ubiquinone oxidoreductase chain 4L n=1 Tax=Neoamphitrite affinis TaxID=2716569 RepID=A0A8F9RSF3_9ANNE|nr:NADH dehydrogenase subunit 4L [Neoamphitrite affinis]